MFAICIQILAFVIFGIHLINISQRNIIWQIKYINYLYHIIFSGYPYQLSTECLYIVWCRTVGDWARIWASLLYEHCIFAYTSAELIWHLGKRALFHLRAHPYPYPSPSPIFLIHIHIPSQTHPIVLYSSSVGRGVHVWLSFWGYANCYADIIINSLGKQAGNKLGFEWVIVFLRCAAFLYSSIFLLP